MIGLWLLVGGLAAADTWTSTTREPLREADVAYRAGLAERADTEKARQHFARAAKLYAAYDGNLWHRYPSPFLCRNLAQSYLLAGDLGRAIAAYRRAMWADWYDRASQEGLAYARSKVAYPLEGPLAQLARPREQPTVLDWDPWSADAAVSWLYFLGCLALARAWMKRLPAWWAAGGLLLALAGLLYGAVHWESHKRHREWSDRNWVVTVARDTPLRTGNSSEYPLRLDQALPAGVELRRLAERGGWVQVQLTGGPVGWVPRDSVTLVE